MLHSVNGGTDHADGNGPPSSSSSLLHQRRSINTRIISNNNVNNDPAQPLEKQHQQQQQQQQQQQYSTPIFTDSLVESSHHPNTAMDDWRQRVRYTSPSEQIRRRRWRLIKYGCMAATCIGMFLLTRLNVRMSRTARHETTAQAMTLSKGGARKNDIAELKTMKERTASVVKRGRAMMKKGKGGRKYKSAANVWQAEGAKGLLGRFKLLVFGGENHGEEEGERALASYSTNSSSSMVGDYAAYLIPHPPPALYDADGKPVKIVPIYQMSATPIHSTSGKTGNVAWVESLEEESFQGTQQQQEQQAQQLAAPGTRNNLPRLKMKEGLDDDVPAVFAPLYPKHLQGNNDRVPQVEKDEVPLPLPFAPEEVDSVRTGPGDPPPPPLEPEEKSKMSVVVADDLSGDIENKNESTTFSSSTFANTRNLTFGDIDDDDSSPQAQDQMIVIATVATMALLVGALSARRLRSRQFLSSCIENESLEEDAAFDDDHTTSGEGGLGGLGGVGYDTFKESNVGLWRGDLEKFDV